MPTRIELPRSLHTAMVRTARLRAPAEYIAVLGGGVAGSARILGELIELPNAACDVDRFVVDAAAFARAEASLRARGRSWLGFVHSHPDGVASPSCSDRTELWRDCLQMIVAGDDVRAYWFAADGACAPVAVVMRRSPARSDP